MSSRLLTVKFNVYFFIKMIAEEEVARNVYKFLGRCISGYYVGF